MAPRRPCICRSSSCRHLAGRGVWRIAIADASSQGCHFCPHTNIKYTTYEPPNLVPSSTISISKFKEKNEHTQPCPNPHSLYLLVTRPRIHSSKPRNIMPLVVPGLMGSTANNDNNINSQQEEWLNKLVGKKLTDGASSGDNTVGTQCFNLTLISFPHSLTHSLTGA